MLTYFIAQYQKSTLVNIITVLIRYVFKCWEVVKLVVADSSFSIF